MGYFIFAGDMIVMLFMTALVTWVFVWSSQDQVDASANIPLADEGENPLQPHKKSAEEVSDNHG